MSAVTTRATFSLSVSASLSLPASLSLSAFQVCSDFIQFNTQLSDVSQQQEDRFQEEQDCEGHPQRHPDRMGVSGAGGSRQRQPQDAQGLCGSQATGDLLPLLQPGWMQVWNQVQPHP